MKNKLKKTIFALIFLTIFNAGVSLASYFKRAFKSDSATDKKAEKIETNPVRNEAKIAEEECVLPANGEEDEYLFIGCNKYF